MNTEIKPSVPYGDMEKHRERAVVGSALWAAAGDALGWITELSRGPSGVAHRTGSSEVTRPVNWRRLIGGRNGPRVDLPAGTYSDDTQLRLAVCRSIRGDGSFDVETFGKIEVTVWPTYALGGGLGTKAAAVNLSRRSVNWFSNFFESAGQKYVNGGGNGAAMRIQPHVWSSSNLGDRMLLNVLRDALVTHGHPHGFCGAMFHALCLSDAISTGQIPEPKSWHGYIDRFSDFGRFIGLDPQLSAFWQSAWANDGGIPVTQAIEKMMSEARSDLDVVLKLLGENTNLAYHDCLDAVGCLTPKFRGSGFKTALAAVVLAYLHRNQNPSVALVVAANELESDTDTIATMAGALLGAVSDRLPEWPVQDSNYIVQEARRLAAIARGEPQDSFSYPDLGHWNPPAKQTASIGWRKGKLAIVGLGILEPLSEEYRSGDAVWQWLALPFGQTILAKRKSNLTDMIADSQLPGPRQKAKPTPQSTNAGPTPPSVRASDSARGRESIRQQDLSTPAKRITRNDIDAWTDEVIHSNFDDLALGRLLNLCIDATGSVDAAVAFSAIVAKAKLARQRRRS
ncbi:ADP-ribosylglycohydrolase family protein [Mesorhizobium sp. M0204]|uniref:ADP-ribosylglycohydrolase family protein n=1 Tax=unclassified Mesorhizobium TaxID=325217 RepID=UPI003337B765